MDVEIWSKDRALLSKAPNFARLLSLEANGLTLSVNDFIANGLFTEQKDDIPQFATRRSLRRLVGSRMSKTLDYFDFDSGTVAYNFDDQNDADINEKEKVGVAGAVAVADRLYGLTQADWRKVPVKSQKTLDFYTFSNGKQIAGLEAKCRTDPRDVPAAVHDIHAKKMFARGGGSVVPLLGVVVTPASKGGPHRAKCVVCDPWIPEIDAEPYKYRLLARMAFYSDIIANISRSPLLQALIQRVTDIAWLSDYLPLNGVELVNVRGEPYYLPASLSASLEPEPSIKLVGEFLFDAGRDALLFMGLEPEVVPMLAGQRFDDILSYRNEVLEPIREITIRAAVLVRELGYMGLRDVRSRENNRRKVVLLRGAFMKTSSGAVLGEFVLADDV